MGLPGAARPAESASLSVGRLLGEQRARGWEGTLLLKSNKLQIAFDREHGAAVSSQSLPLSVATTSTARMTTPTEKRIMSYSFTGLQYTSSLSRPSHRRIVQFVAIVLEKCTTVIRTDLIRLIDSRVARHPRGRLLQSETY